MKAQAAEGGLDTRRITSCQISFSDQLRVEICPDCRADLQGLAEVEGPLAFCESLINETLAIDDKRLRPTHVVGEIHLSRRRQPRGAAGEVPHAGISCCGCAAGIMLIGGGRRLGCHGC